MQSLIGVPVRSVAIVCTWRLALLEVLCVVMLKGMVCTVWRNGEMSSSMQKC